MHAARKVQTIGILPESCNLALDMSGVWPQNHKRMPQTKIQWCVDRSIFTIGQITSQTSDVASQLLDAWPVDNDS